MSATAAQPALLPDLTPVPGRFVNARCIVHEQDGLRVALVDAAPFHTWPVGDVVAENLFVVQARQAQVASIEELAAALERPVSTLYLALRQYTEGGVVAVTPKRRGRPPGSGRDILRDAAIRRLHREGAWNRAIATQLKCNAVTVDRALARMGLEPNRKRQLPLPGTPEPSAPAASPSPEEPVPAEMTGGSPTTERDPDGGSAPETRSEPAARTFDVNPLDRSLDRFLASQGELTDAAPLFAPGANLPHLGALLAVPGLVQSGLLVEARRLYGDIGPAFYGLRTTLVAVVLFSLLRLKRPEHLKEYAPPELGQVLGLDRAPEVKTLRRKLHRLADGPSDALLLAVAQRRARGRPEALAWLYVDGHVRVYNGTERLPMAHVTRLRISMPATQDMWVHDGDGRPVLFVTQEAHPSLATALPPMLEAAREVAGDRRVTVVFDRGGWSPDLFAQLVEAGTDILTYRKGPSVPIPAEWFESRTGRPKEPDWLLHDQSTRLPNGLWVRQITRLVGQHQTTIVTTRQDLPPEVLARRMFDRWRQENFFKYMREEFDLDGLYEYGTEEDDPLRETPNPERTRRDKALRKAREGYRTALARHSDPQHPDVRDAAVRVDELRRQRDAVPRRVQVGDLATPTVRLPARVKNLYDGLKTIAWQIETDLVNALEPFYKRNEDEGRTLITAALRSSGALSVSDEELTITLTPQSSPHRTKALVELCRLLDATETRFPGTRLRLRYRVAADHLTTAAGAR
jgi:transposase